ncbi:ComF family protein [Amycolatopsis sp. EV170708-02-1]|uniref:ComF family protein n=1 Tax=Amycolatopsis sp. EV170708-02-1 TaxID=2919322 RepID=UPI001F0BD6CF|nr:phosphoribosyltransferase family protein [Amycolatopsis sp. EV170708-02-1]UMP01277.1 hypothetical protein MJQ72_33290 [Amycolatopsis sp. EV170708-02-1]
MDFPEPPELQDLLRLQSEVLTLHVASTVVVNTAIALDFYNKPDADELKYTDTGQLLHSLKYGRHTPDETTRLGRKLCAALCDVVDRHPLFRDATRLLPVPGSTRRLSDRIGSTLHRDLGIPLTHVTRRSVATRPAKDMTSRERAERINDFSIDEGLAGERVLIVDDLYRTGRTLAEVARVAHSAGADTVYGLVAARTLGSRDKPPTLYRWQPR